MVKITLDTAPYVVVASDGVTVFREADEFAKKAANTDLITFDAVMFGCVIQLAPFQKPDRWLRQSPTP